ncbi:MAG: hypothetical protein HY794_00595 [Desulfarculus sp.]|nr:hypothetical protein [Desulfarculus sp.]
MTCHVHNLELPGSSGADIHDVTPQVLAAVLDLDNRPRRRRVVIQVLGEQDRGA